MNLRLSNSRYLKNNMRYGYHLSLKMNCLNILMIEYFICPVCIAFQGYFNILEFILSFTINLFFFCKRWQCISWEFCLHFKLECNIISYTIRSQKWVLESQVTHSWNSRLDLIYAWNFIDKKYLMHMKMENIQHSK